MIQQFTTAALLGLLCIPFTAGAQEPSKSKAPVEKTENAEKTEKPVSKIEKATFAAGCFWSIEAVFERVPGVKQVVSGFSGGTVPFPSYQQVCTGMTGHAESVQIIFDSSVVTYDKLLALYFKAHDPTTLNAQGDDFGTQYRSAIFYHSEAQREAAIAMYKDLTKRRVFRAPIVTQLLPYQAFYPAEAYHQDYYTHHLGDNYSTLYIEPKLKKLHLMPTRSRRTRPAASRTRSSSKSENVDP